MDAIGYYGFVALLFALSVGLGRISGPIVIRVLEFFTGKTKSTLDDRVLDAVKVPLESFFFLIVFYLLLHNFPDLIEAAQFLDKYTYAMLVLIATFMLSEATGAGIRWYYEEGHKTARRMKVDLSLLPLVRKVTKVAIYAVGLTVALSAAGFDVTGLLAVTSIAGLILGLAAQETLGNIFAGIALQVDRPYNYGDCLKLPSGEIARLEKIGMRTTRLSDTSQNAIIISNSEFAKLRVTNLTLPGEESIVSVQIELPLRADARKMQERIEARLRREKPQGLMIGKGIALSTDAVRLDSVVYSVSFWVDGYLHSGAIKETINSEALLFAKGK